MSSGGLVQVRVLGSIEAVSGGEQVALSPQLRRLLGLLVVANGSPVSADRLAEYVADGNTDGSTVRTAVSRLRKALDGRVESSAGGYKLALEADELDWSSFETLRKQARTAPAEARIGALTKALELWRGPAFGDLADEEWATGWSAKIDAAHAVTIEDLAESMVSTGRAASAIEVLEPHVLEHPFRERPVALLMRALDTNGRTSDALRAYERFRIILRDETGLEPSSELHDLEAELLGGLDPDRPTVPTESPLPTGTVTFLFSDIEGSTQRWQDDEEAMSEALTTHDEILRSVVEQHGGAVFKHTGDGICSVFVSPSDAVTASVEAQKQLNLPVRIGVHTGVAELRGRDYFGTSLNRAARIMDAGHGGQILISEATAGLVDDIDTTDMGQHHLKGLTNPERILQVGTHEFPPLRVAKQRKGNLPTELSSFIGRATEIDKVADAVIDQRLVTLLGVGGTGKTRLSIEVATHLAPTYPDGCWIAELAIVSAPEAVPLAIAAGLGIRAPEEGDVTDHIIRRVRHQRLLLIIDNCEHLLNAAADVAERIMSECSAITIIATSREPLLINGEQLIPVPSLKSDDAVTLFLDRARSEAPGLELDEVQAVAVSELCERLDQLPLAIELAASRLRAMTPVEVLERLDERFRLLVGGRRSRMERHQTMRGTLDWSYDLCDEAERAVFDRLSVFPAEFDMHAARAVAAHDTISDLDVIDMVPRLVDRSLLNRITSPDGTSRYRMLETMRAYGREHLRDQDIADTIRRQHAHYMAATVAALSLRAMGPDEDHVHAVMRSLTPDAFVALDWLIDQHDWDRAVRAAAVGWPHNYRVLYEMNRRLSDAIISAQGSLDLIEPNARFHLLLLSVEPGGADIFLFEDQFRMASTEIVFGEVPLAVDVSLLSPFHGYLMGNVFGEGDDAEVSEWLDSLDDLDDLPVIHQFNAMHAVFEGVGQHGDPTIALSRTPRLQAVLKELNSQTAQRRFDALRSIQEEQLGNRELAAQLAQDALPSGSVVPSNFDFMAACRLIRNRVLAGLDISTEEIRRPVEWLREFDLGNRLLVATTMVHVADYLGNPALGDRLLAWVRDEVPEARSTYASILSTQGLGERFKTAPSHDQDLESLFDEVLAAAAAHPVSRQT